MDPFDLQEAIRSLDRQDVVRVANEARPAGDYLFNTLLPERLRYDYQARTAGMTVRATMAGLAAMDSPYPPAGQFELTEFSEETAKIGSRTGLSEAGIREIQQLLMHLRLDDQPTLPRIQQTALNFLDKIVLQAHLDTMEWLRGQALQTGAIAWTFGDKVLSVDYGIDSTFFFTARTSTAAWDSSASEFWTDIKLLRRKLRKYNGIQYIAHPDTIDAIRYNTANALSVVQEGEGGITFRRRAATQDATYLPGTEDTVTLIPYGLEGEVHDLAHPGQTVTVPFMATGKILAVARGNRRRFEVGDGGTPPSDIALGYTHLAPTVENGGRPGRWADLRVPDDRPWTFEGRGVTNGLPVIEAIDRFAVANSDLT